MKNLIALSVLLIIFKVLVAQKLEIAKNGNLRSGPTVSSKIIGKATIGMKGTQTDYSLGWYKIELTNKTTGWIYQTLIKRDKPWDNDRAMKFFIQARNKSKEKDYKSALAELDSTTLYNPELYEAWIMSGFINGMLDKTVEANEAFSMAIEIDPKKPDGYFNRGRVFVISGDNEKACADWKLADKLGSTEAREFIDEFCIVKTISTTEYIGHISEIATYPTMIISGDCPLNALIEVSLKEYGNMIFKMSDTDATKYGLIEKPKRSEGASGGSIIISPNDNNSTKILGKGWKVKLNALECNSTNSKKYMLVTSCKKLIQPPPAKK